MLDEPRDLPGVERRMASVRAVQTVMGAVWALARSQQPSVDAAARQANAYVDVAGSIAARLAGEPRRDRDPHGHLWVLVGPERPFCGPLARMLLRQLPKGGAVALAGGRVAQVAEQDRALKPRVVFQVPSATVPEELGPRATQLAAAILRTGHRSVVLLHPHSGTPDLRRSPLIGGMRAPVRAPPETFLPLADVLGAAVTESIAGQLAAALAESLRSEVQARLVAADAARTACGRTLKELEARRRVLRQSAITEELLEITASRDPHRW